MIVRNLKIRNFRCFEKFNVDFGSKATVLFGKNGSGKSSLISALHKALSFTMYSDIIYKIDSTRSSSRSAKVIDRVNSIAQGNPYLRVQGFSKTGDYNNHQDHLIEIETDATLSTGEPISWTMSAITNKNRLRTSGFIKAFRKFYNSFCTTNHLPLLAYYSDSFPHKEDSKKATIKSKISELRSFGYFDWDAVEGCTKEWTNRLESDFLNISNRQNLISKLEKSDPSDKNAKEAIRLQKENIRKWQNEIDAVENCIVRFSKEISSGHDESLRVIAMAMHSEYGKLCVITADGAEILFSTLPAGYKRLFNIVLDLAFRSYILSEKSTTRLQGIAVIDEIDLHLHPGLENVVLPGLISIFPDVQFIVSTHSPGVLTNLDTNTEDIRILLMSEHTSSPQLIHDIYGLDPNSTLQEVMGVTLNGESLKRMIAQCAFMISRDLLIQADNLKTLILAKSPIGKDELERRINKELSTLL